MGAKSVGEIVASLPAPRSEKKLGASKLRVVEAAGVIAETSDVPIAYQHSWLCQTCLPYTDPGNETLYWDRENGFVSLSLAAGRAYHPEKKWVQMGLPFGPKPRQILCYLNTEAIVQQHWQIDVERTLSSFVKAMKLDHNGRNFRTVREQMARVAAADFRLGVTTEPNAADTHKGTIVQSFNLWAEPVDGQRVFWPRTVTLDERYFRSLLEHAVPLNAHALAALGHSALALDCYAWLAQRLHRVKPTAPAFITWLALQHQFGEGYARIRDFRRKFKIALDQVKQVYAAARFETDEQGMTLYNSAPPVAKRMVQVLDVPSKAG